MAIESLTELAALQADLQELASLPDSLVAEMLNAEADIIIQGQKNSAREYGTVDTGQMAASIKKGAIKKLKSGDRCIYVGPSGTRTRDGITTRNAEIAFINEFGKHGQPARPFINTANERYADKAVDAAFKIYDRYLTSKNL